MFPLVNLAGDRHSSSGVAMRFRLFAVLLLNLLLPGSLRAQVGVTTDIIVGTVTDSAGQPVPQATVDALSLETGVIRSAATDQNGRYRILFPDGGGRYQVFGRAIGMSPVRRVAQRDGDDDRLVVNLRLGNQTVQLEDITVRSRRGVRGGQGITPGSTETIMTPDALARLPIDAGDLTAIALLAPGVVSVEGTDSTAAGFSVAGQRPSANAITLDGLTFGASSIPQDAVRNTRVVTNTYDVARGQFSGGLVASTTRSGTNALQATLNANLRDPSLAVVPESSTVVPRSQQQLSFGVGGPLVRQRLYGFASGQLRHSDDRLVTALTLADGGGAERFGLSSDSLARYLGILSELGVAQSAPGESLTGRIGDNYSGLARVDVLLGRGETVTLRGDVRRSTQEPARLSSLAVPASGGTSAATGGGIMMQVSSQLGGGVLNEAKGYLSWSRNHGDAYLALPQGRVQVLSALADSGTTPATLVFGGSPSFPQRQRASAFEATDEVSWLPGDASHRIKLGLFYTTQRTTQAVSNNLLGSFTFQSLADLEADRPSYFTRILGPTERTGSSSTSAVYLGDIWRTSAALQLTYGARVEHSWFGDAPAYNPAADSLFGLRTDGLPRETRVSPRAGFTWLLRTPDGPPVWTIRGGAGQFRSPIPSSLAVYAQSATGLDIGERQLVCAGALAPPPDWAAYAADPGAVPAACADGSSGAPDPAATAPPSITAFTTGYTAPRVWRSSLGVQRRLGFLSLGVDGTLGFGVSQGGFEDRNLGAPRFTLTSEAGREVFVPPSAIDPASGVAPLAASRLHPEFGQVFAAIATLTTRSAQLVLSANGLLPQGIVLRGSYTWSRSTDQSSFDQGGGRGGFAARTAGRTISEDARSFSDFDRRHQVVATITVPVVPGLEITSIGRLTSGAPYTPVVSGDINGDGARNDRAFIADPAATADTALANGITRLLGTAPGRIRDCLSHQSGSIAARNSCRGPWQPSLDLQVNWRPAGLGLDRRLSISLVTSNLLAGVDQLVHGAGALHGWGQFSRPDAMLLTVTGFDPATNRYTYAVNERFGQTIGTQGALRQPFQVGVQMRFALGGGLFGGFGGGRGGFDGGGGGGFRGGAGGLGGGRPLGVRGAADSASGMRTRLATILANPVQPIRDRNIALHMTDDQVARLDSVASRFSARRDSLADVIQAELQRAGPNPDPAQVIRSLRSRLAAGRTLQTEALEAAHGVLSPAQWAQLPPEAREVPQRFGGRAGARPPVR